MAQPTPAQTATNVAYAAALTHASRHRAELEGSKLCACFFCFRTFANTAIHKWIDDKQTALCPGCGIDSVIGAASGLSLDDKFLRKLHQHHFGYRSR